MRKYRLLDLFSGEGGAGEGYARAGFIVHGIDIKSQPRYPYTFTRCDALEYLEANGHLYDVIHASPTCQRFSQITKPQYRENHKDYIEPLRNLLEKIGKPYVMENVTGARSRLKNPVMLCGSMFGLKIWRHRYFEIKPTQWFAPATCNHSFQPIPVNNSSVQKIATKAEASLGMGIDWMTRYGIGQAIPPAYTEWIGRQLIRHLEHSARTPELAV